MNHAFSLQDALDAPAMMKMLAADALEVSIWIKGTAPYVKQDVIDALVEFAAPKLEMDTFLP